MRASKLIRFLLALVALANVGWAEAQQTRPVPTRTRAFQGGLRFLSAVGPLGAAPVLTRTSGATGPIDYTTSFPVQAQHAGYVLRTQVSATTDFSGALEYDGQYVIHVEDYADGKFPWATYDPPFNPSLGVAPHFIRSWYHNGADVVGPYSNTLDATIAQAYNLTFSDTKYDPASVSLSNGNRTASGVNAGAEDSTSISLQSRPAGTGKYWIVAQLNVKGSGSFALAICNPTQTPNGPGAGGANSAFMFFNADGVSNAFAANNGNGIDYPMSIDSGITLPNGWYGLLLDKDNGTWTAYQKNKKGAPLNLAGSIQGEHFACMRTGPGTTATWQAGYVPAGASDFVP